MLKLGIVANEFFDVSSGRMGGFGWVARAVANTFRDNPALGLQPLFLTRQAQHGQPKALDGVPLVGPQGSRIAQLRDLARLRLDLLLTIDYRADYRWILIANPRTPLVLWVHDPRTPFDLERLATLRVPDQPDVPAQGVEPIDATAFRWMNMFAGVMRRRVVVATHARYLRDKVEGTYHIFPDEVLYLPDPLFVPRGPFVKPSKPQVVFLARLDPYKRPWLFVELARHFPNVDFVALGQSHFSGPGSWNAPAALPANLHLMGHVDEPAKIEYLRKAWLLVNTSIHEALPIAFLEALAFEVPIVADQDPDEVVSRFGAYVPRTTGSGEEALPYFIQAIEGLLADDSRRERLGRQGRQWVEHTHNRRTFAEGFSRVAARAGLFVPNVTTVEPHPIGQ